MKQRILILAGVVALMSLPSCGNDKKDPDDVLVDKLTVNVSETEFSVGAEAGEVSFTLNSTRAWNITCDKSWITLTPQSGVANEETEVTISYGKNNGAMEREATIYVVSNNTRGATLTLTQGFTTHDEIEAPEGYSLVWLDEFNEGTRLGADWVIENQPSGWVNNELQNYTSREIDGKPTTEIKDGCLHINCFKASDGKVYSGRVYARPDTGWEYGYFEARIKLPSGKGTWPAFWMMPSNNDWSTNWWPLCGEIDIMEEVGVDANRVSSSLHTENYNHTKNTQKTHEMYLDGAEGDFHVYALEWTPEEITTYVDGVEQLHATKADMGTDHASWPFHYEFYPILNLAWGGDWGGYKGVDESALPVTMEVDYVRIFQKK